MLHKYMFKSCLLSDYSLWCEVGVHLVEGLERLGRLCLKRRLAGQALEHDRPQAPQVRLGVVLEGHDDLGSLELIMSYPILQVFKI